MEPSPRHWRQQRDEGLRSSRGLGWIILYTITILAGAGLAALLLYLAR